MHLHNKCNTQQQQLTFDSLEQPAEVAADVLPPLVLQEGMEVEACKGHAHWSVAHVRGGSSSGNLHGMQHAQFGSTQAEIRSSAYGTPSCNVCELPHHHQGAKHQRCGAHELAHKVEHLRKKRARVIVVRQ